MHPNSSEALTHTMSNIMRLHRHTLHLLLQQQGIEVYPGQPPLLFRLSEEDGQSQKELARKLRIKPATLTVMLTRMEKTGLVRRMSDTRDQRISRVFLTERGRQAIQAVKETMQSLELHTFEEFTAEEKLLLRRFLLHMQNNLKQIEESI
ncbi:MarR family transcriptional regulator [Paenibacillus doosanensis]|nr:MarR family transcriptional regulator [Paenibacillus doosanensis]MCS7459576.1 MarR family transcriptional regulator [Paenibacillus doosanensis]